MNSDQLKTVIDKIEKIAGSCSYYEDDLVEDTDILELRSDEYEELEFEIDKDTELVSVFLSFGYCDFNKEEYERGRYDTEDIEMETRTKLLESSSTLYFKAHSYKYFVSVWDDGNYMCPGYTARVGFYHEEYSDEMLKEFLRLYQDYLSTVGSLNDTELKLYIFKCICHNHGIKVSGNTNLSVGSASVEFGNTTLPCSNIKHFYFGKEKFLFSVEGQNYAAEVCPIKLFVEIQNMCELFDNIVFFFVSSHLNATPTLKIFSAGMVLSIPASADTNGLYSQIEESTVIISHSTIIPFASQKFKKLYTKEYKTLLEPFAGDNPLIITEGSTDWKHMKKYWEQYIKQIFTVKFFEFEPVNSSKTATIKQDMGSSMLLEMCKAYSKIKLGRVFIFIADRDEPKIIKEMSDESKPYKYWGNGVYSLVLPVPEHRISTPEICIEHYYSDDDIRTFYSCSDKKERRLFLGNDFDKYGRDIEHGLLCVKRSLCGADSIKVIDGSNDTRVISMSESNDINYALSKQEFAAQSKIIKNSTAYAAFSNLFDIIKRIVNISNSANKNDMYSM